MLRRLGDYLVDHCQELRVANQLGFLGLGPARGVLDVGLLAQLDALGVNAAHRLAVGALRRQVAAQGRQARGLRRIGQLAVVSWRHVDCKRKPLMQEGLGLTAPLAADPENPIVAPEQK